jgi:hypothetical protein
MVSVNISLMLRPYSGLVYGIFQIGSYFFISRLVWDFGKLGLENPQNTALPEETCAGCGSAQIKL